MGCIWVVARILRTGDSRLWLWFGVLAGLGLENKHSTLSFGFAVTVALLLTHYRREFAKQWIWIAGAIALVIFLPNIIWQIRHHFPTIEDLENVRREGKNVILGPVAFVKEQILTQHPILLPVWFGGLIWFLRDRRWRVLGLTFVVFFVLMEVAHAKNYYVFPIYPMLFAGGAVVIERWLANRFVIIEHWVVNIPVWTRGAVVALIRARFPPHSSAYDLDAAARTSPRLSNRDRLQARQGRSQPRVAAAATHRRPVWMARDGPRGRGHLQLPAARRARPDRHLGGQLRRSRRHQFVRPAIRIATRLLAPRPPPQVYKNLIVIEWSLDDVRDNCTSFQPFEHYNLFGMGEENQPMYLCRGVEFDIQKIWWHSHHWN